MPLALGPSMKPVPIETQVKITAGYVNVHFAGRWDGYPDEVRAPHGATGGTTA